MPELANCPDCGGLFVKALRSVCETCAKDVEAQFDTVYSFIRKRDNRRATIDEVVESTGVTKERIFQFIREGRILLSQFPNLTYPCDACGKDIREGKLCSTCRSRIESGIEQSNREKDFSDRKAVREKSRYTTYHSLEGKVRKDR
ncbi:TIGR03826 family flagellar region protein [Bacillus daqingensis]|uniref:TIGR03826 family flagellar region protein n=1 Tax=Bacillus daqingensis TaxID=872396 RepID=A0ABV9NXD8_9BACI